MGEKFPLEKGLTGVWIGYILALFLFFIMMSPITSRFVNLWYTMACCGLMLTLIGHKSNPNLLSISFNLKSLLWGVLIAAGLWGIFWIGNWASAHLFSFSTIQVGRIYNFKIGSNQWIIGLFLFFIIGPAEEIFWRGFVQKKLSIHWGKNIGFIVATLMYTSVHFASCNFMLIMAAFAAGFYWGLIYKIFPHSLPALIISHSLWDVCTFLIFPIH